MDLPARLRGEPAPRRGRQTAPWRAARRTTNVTCALGLGAAMASARPLHAEPRLGVAAEVGVPEGGRASLVVAPLRSLRLAAGVAHNLVSTGVAASASWSPLTTWAAPTVSIGYGHFPEGDANPLARKLSGDGALSSPLLDEVGYDYACAHLGLELGGDRVRVALAAGASRVTTRARGLAAELTDRAGASMPAQLSFPTDPEVTIWSASARLGLVVYFSP